MMKQQNKAIEHYTQAIVMKQDVWWCWAECGQFLAEHGYWDRARPQIGLASRHRKSLNPRPLVGRQLEIEHREILAHVPGVGGPG